MSDTGARPHQVSAPEVWYLYALRTRDGAIYTGIATDVARRLSEHEGAGPRGAKSLRGKGPLELLYRVRLGDRRTALRAEYAMKQLSHAEKSRIASSNPDAETLISVLGIAS